MSDLSGYRNQVADLGKTAVQAEKDGNWEMAYDAYKSALTIFIHMIKCKLIIFQNSTSNFGRRKKRQLESNVQRKVLAV